MPSCDTTRKPSHTYTPKPDHSPPVTVFVGGTSGIGRAMAEAFARHTSGNCHIVVVGRNREAGAAIVSGLPTFSSPPAPDNAHAQAPAEPSTTHSPQHTFLPADLSLIHNVHTLSARLLALYPKINFLILTPGFLTLSSRAETAEGLDRKMVLHYYARWALVYNLIPALRRACEEGEDTGVLSVGSPRREGAGESDIDTEDLGLRRGYTPAKSGRYCSIFVDLMIEEFAMRNPGVRFMHAYPGFVRTPLMSSSSSPLLRFASPLLVTLAYPLSTSPEDCAERMWSALYDSEQYGPGAWRVGSKGENLGKKEAWIGDERLRRAVWEHTEGEVVRLRGSDEEGSVDRVGV